MEFNARVVDLDLSPISQSPLTLLETRHLQFLIAQSGTLQIAISGNLNPAQAWLSRLKF